MTSEQLKLIERIQSVLYYCDNEVLNAIYVLVQNNKERSIDNGLREAYKRAAEKNRSGRT